MSDTPIVPGERLMIRSILSSSSDRSGPDAKARALASHAPKSGTSSLRRPRIIFDVIVQHGGHRAPGLGRMEGFWVRSRSTRPGADLSGPAGVLPLGRHVSNAKSRRVERFCWSRSQVLVGLSVPANHVLQILL